MSSPAIGYPSTKDPKDPKDPIILCSGLSTLRDFRSALFSSFESGKVNLPDSSVAFLHVPLRCLGKPPWLKLVPLGFAAVGAGMRLTFSTWSFLLLRLLRTAAIPSEDLGEPKPCAPGQDCEIDGFVGSKVIFEDEMVRVWNFTLPPGGMTSLHRHDLATWRKFHHGMRFFHFRVSMGHKKSAGKQKLPLVITSPQLPPMICEILSEILLVISSGEHPAVG